MTNLLDLDPLPEAHSSPLLCFVQQCDLARLRGGHGVGDPNTAADLARRLASLHVGQQLAAQQQASSAQLQQQAQAHSDQNAVLMQLLATLAQKVIFAFSRYCWSLHSFRAAVPSYSLLSWCWATADPLSKQI
jgi:hypothetical protein